MKKKAKPLLLLAVVLVLVLLAIVRCGRSKTLDLSGVDADPNRYAYGSSADYNVSVGDVGLFYTKAMGEQIRFYDLDAKQSYVLCSRANCTHMTDKCPAYFMLNVTGSAADNVAQVGQYIYCTYLANAANGQQLMDENGGAAYQLIRIDPADGSRKLIASFPAVHNAADGDESFYASNLGSVEYCGGWAWFDLQMQQPEKNDVQELSFCQLTGVNLETGQVVALNQYESEYNDYRYAFETITSDTVYFYRSRDVLPVLTRDDFYDVPQGKRKSSIKVGDMEFHDYSEYWDWYCSYGTKEYDTYSYSVETGETKNLFSGQTVSAFRTTHSTQGIDRVKQSFLYYIYGSFEGKPLVRALQEDSEGNYNANRYEVFLLNPDTGERESVLELEYGSVLTIAQGYHPNFVFPDGTLLYMNYHDDQADIYSLDLNTKKSTFLFTDDAAITFRIFGEYKGGYFGKHKDHQDDMSFYWISKEDFYAGNLDKAIKYQL